MTRARDIADLVDANGDVVADALDNAASFASGTVMMFQQTSAPTGWTKLTTNDDAAIRVVSGTCSTGGSVGMATALATPSLSGSTGAHTLTTSEIPSHNHTNGVQLYSTVIPRGANYPPSYSVYDGTRYTGSTGSGGSHNHSMSGTATINVKYVDVIAASKD